MDYCRLKELLELSDAQICQSIPVLIFSGGIAPLVISGCLGENQKGKTCFKFSISDSCLMTARPLVMYIVPQTAMSAVIPTQLCSSPRHAIMNFFGGLFIVSIINSSKLVDSLKHRTIKKPEITKKFQVEYSDLTWL